MLNILDWKMSSPSFSKKKKLVEKEGKKKSKWVEIEATNCKTTIALLFRHSEVNLVIFEKLVNSKLNFSFHVFFRFPLSLCIHRYVSTAPYEVLGRKRSVRFFWLKTAKSVGASSEASYKTSRSLPVSLRPLIDRPTRRGHLVLGFVELETVWASKFRLLSIFRQNYIFHV